MSAAFEIQKAIFNRLANDSQIQNLVKGVFDEVPENQKFPYITIGEFKEEPENTFGGKGWITEPSIDIWSQSKGFKEALDIYNEVERLFDGANLELGGNFECVDCRISNVESFREFDENLGVVRHVNIVFKIFTQEK